MVVPLLLWGCSLVQPSREADGSPPGGLQLVELGPDAFGEVRSYWVHLPDGRVPEQPLPVLFAFHGGKGTNGRAAMARHWTSQYGAPLILVFPNGQLRDRETGGWDDQRATGAGAGFQVEVVERMVADVVSRFHGDRAHVYAVGFSSGGHVVNQLACSAGDLFAGFGRTGRTLLATTRDACTTPTDAPQIMILGTDDDSARVLGKLDPRTGEPHELSARDAWGFWLDRAGCTGEPTVERLPDTGDACDVDVQTWLTCRDTPAMRYVDIVHGRHEWSRAGDPHSFCRDLDTTETFVQFFRQYAGLTFRPD